VDRSFITKKRRRRRRKKKKKKKKKTYRREAQKIWRLARGPWMLTKGLAWLILS
jgi:hypothetical protein